MAMTSVIVDLKQCLQDIKQARHFLWWLCKPRRDRPAHPLILRDLPSRPSIPFTVFKAEQTWPDISSDNDIGASCEVSRLLRKLCGSSGAKNERSTGAKNAQLLCVNGGSPRQPSTPQLLRILEETIQKKAPKPQYYLKPKVKDVDRFRLTFNVTSKAADALFQYRTKFVQHMLSSPMYANSAVGKPWEMIGTVSEQIINEVLLSCAKEMQLEDFIKELYKSETQ